MAERRVPRMIWETAPHKLYDRKEGENTKCKNKRKRKHLGKWKHKHLEENFRGALLLGDTHPQSPATPGSPGVTGLQGWVGCLCGVGARILVGHIKKNKIIKRINFTYASQIHHHKKSDLRLHPCSGKRPRQYHAHKTSSTYGSYGTSTNIPSRSN